MEKILNEYEIELENIKKKPENIVKLLGVTLDRHLTFGAHIDAAVLKAHSGLGILRKSSQFLPQNWSKLVFLSLVRPHLEYCSAVFASAAVTHLKKLDIVQKIGGRIIVDAARDAHSAPILEQLGIHSLHDRRKNHVYQLVGQILQGVCHPALREMFRENEDGVLASSSTYLDRTKLGTRRFSSFAVDWINNSTSD